MPRLRVIHWKEEEAGPLLKALRAARYKIDYDERPTSSLIKVVRETKPDAIVIDLSRQPSHGRWVGISLRATKSTRQIPLIFVGGEEEKLVKLRNALPDATYTTLPKAAAAIKRAIANPPVTPVVAPPMMESFHDRTTAQKIGIKEGSRVALYDAPPDYARALGQLPDNVSLEEEPAEILPITLWFVRDLDKYLTGLRTRRALAAKSKLWIVWPKGRRDGINGNQIREAALAMGLVDYKICSVNEVWTAMVFTVKKA
jgi:hypothetical protein